MATTPEALGAIASDLHLPDIDPSEILLPAATEEQIAELWHSSCENSPNAATPSSTIQTPDFGALAVPKSVTRRSAVRNRRLSSLPGNGSNFEIDMSVTVPPTIASPPVSTGDNSVFLSPAESEFGACAASPPALGQVPAEKSPGRSTTPLDAQACAAPYIASEDEGSGADHSSHGSSLGSPGPPEASEYIKRLSNEFARTLLAGMDSSDSEEEHEEAHQLADVDVAAAPSPLGVASGLGEGTPSTRPASSPPPAPQALDDSCSSAGSDDVVVQPRVLTTARKAPRIVSIDSSDSDSSAHGAPTRRRLVPKTPATNTSKDSKAQHVLDYSGASSVQSSGSTPCSVSLTAVKAGMAAAGYGDDEGGQGGYDYRRDSLGVDCYEEDGWLVSDAGMAEGGSCCSSGSEGGVGGGAGGVLDASWSSSGSDSYTGGQSGPHETLHGVYGSSGSAKLDAVFAGGSSKRGKAQREACVAEVYPEFNRLAFDGALPADLQITWSNTLRKTAGLTYTRRVGAARTARVELSSKVCDTCNRTAATLLHELCHVAAWLVDGVHKPPHGRVFKMWAARVSALYPHFEVTTTHSYSIRYKYTYECVACKTTYGRHSKSIDVEAQRCGACEGILRLQTGSQASAPSLAELPMQCDSPSKMDEPDWLASAAGTPGVTPLRVLKGARANAGSASATPKRAPTAFALFVKEHYSSVRGEAGTGMTHGEVMTQLSAKWKARHENA